MKELLNLIRLLQNNSGNKLQEILKDNKDNQLFIDVLTFLYNPYITTGLSTKKINKEVGFTHKETPKHIYEVLNYLREHNTGRDEDISYVKSFLMLQEPADREIFKQIFTKELKLGITARTINKVWGKIIPEFNVMLAEKYWDNIEKLEEEKPDIIITTKLDGIRALMIVSNGKIQIFSRQGKLIEGLVEIEEEALNLPSGCYDGELLLDEPALSSKDLYRATVSVVNSKSETKTNVMFNVFDYLTEDSLFEGKEEVPCYKRKQFVYETLRDLELDYIVPVPVLYQGKYDRDRIEAELEEQIKLENEGVMVNLALAPYETKRTKNILKVKKMQDCDLRIVGFEEGTGKNRGTLGAVLVDYKGFTVGVGSGFTDKDREYIWSHRNELLGRIMVVQYFEETKNKDTNALSLRFPVFKDIAPEGKEVSYY